jgi:hypothetical protein
MLAVWPEEPTILERLKKKSKIYSFLMGGMRWSLASLAVKQKEKKPGKGRSLF